MMAANHEVLALEYVIKVFVAHLPTYLLNTLLYDTFLLVAMPNQLFHDVRLSVLSFLKV